MRAATIPFPMFRSATVPMPNLAMAAAVVALLDLSVCAAYWSALGVPMERVARGPAAWVVGSDAARAMGGWGVLLGMLVLYAIAAVEVAGYRALARRFEAMLHRPVQWGMAYGACMFGFLNWVVLPLSAAPQSQAHGDWLVVLLLIHVCLLGVACAWATRILVRGR